MLENDIEISKLIKKLIPINELTESIQNKVISNADLLEIKKGKHLFKKGDKDHFSYYLLSGEIDLVSNRQIHDTIKEGSDRALYAMAQLQPRQFSAVAKKTTQVLKVNRTVLDKLLLVSKQSPEKKTDLADTISGPGDLEVNEIDDDQNLDWMSRLLQSELFMKIPSGNIQKLFGLLESHNYKAGQVVIEQGQEGEHYYVIQEGKCSVTRKAGASSNPIKLAQLRVGDSFGEESLLMNTKCNATVSMETDGVLMRLSKDNFVELIKKPTLQTISYDKAQELLKVGAAWLDVRFESEHNQSYIEDSQHIPLNLLRTHAKKLSTETQYITYCDTGARSSAAAFLLTERGYKALYLDGGLISQQDIPNLVSNIDNEDEVSIDTNLNEEKPINEEEPIKEDASTTEFDLSEEVKVEESASVAEDNSKEETINNDVKVSNDDNQKELEKEKTRLQKKYAEAQKMLDKAKLIRQEAEKSREKLDAEIEKRNSVIELSQQKVLKELQSRIDELESSKDKLEEKNKKLLSKRIELENELKKQQQETSRLNQEKTSLEEKNKELTDGIKTVTEEKLKALQDSLKAKQDAKRIIEAYKEKHKMLYQMEEEIIEQELQTLDEESSQFTFDNVTQIESSDSSEKNESEKTEENPKIDDDSRNEMSEKLMQEISSQLGQAK